MGGRLGREGGGIRNTGLARTVSIRWEWWARCTRFWWRLFLAGFIIPNVSNLARQSAAPAADAFDDAVNVRPPRQRWGQPWHTPPIDPLPTALVVVAAESRLEDALFIESFGDLLSLDPDERNESVSSSIIGDGVAGSDGSGPVGGNVGGGFEKAEVEVEGIEECRPEVSGVRGEGGMEDGGTGNGSRSSGTITGGTLAGLWVDMGWGVIEGR